MRKWPAPCLHHEKEQKIRNGISQKAASMMQIFHDGQNNANCEM